MALTFGRKLWATVPASGVLLWKNLTVMVCKFNSYLRLPGFSFGRQCLNYKNVQSVSCQASWGHIMLTWLLLPCISWPRVVSWPPSSYFEISINLKACIILEWSIIIRFIITTTFKTCATTHLSV